MIDNEIVAEVHENNITQTTDKQYTVSEELVIDKSVDGGFFPVNAPIEIEIQGNSTQKIASCNTETAQCVVETPLSTDAEFEDGTGEAFRKIVIKGKTVQEADWQRAEAESTQDDSDIYAVKWGKTLATCERIYGAKDITTDFTNFAHRGSVNTNYSNPFDSIQPWAGRKLCNINISAYMSRTTTQSLTDFVTHWENDADFSYSDPDGVWVYTPEFWWIDKDTAEYRAIAVTATQKAGWNHAPATIGARWHGVQETRTIDGESKQVLLSKPGIPCARVSMANMHAYAGNAGLTLEDIYTYSIDWLLMAVEYATLNSQAAVGNGCSDLYKQGVQPVSVDGNTITIATSVAANYLPGAILEIGTTDGGNQIGRTYVVSKTVNATDTTLTDVVYAGDPLPITTAHYVSVHGTINATDVEIGSKSGYIGANYRCNAYYRGRVAHGNMHRYVLGAYRQQGTGHIWIAPNSNAADACDALDTAAHIDTGVSLPQGADGAAYDGYVNALAQLNAVPLPPICSSGGGSSSQPVGDYVYVPTLATVNTVLLAGGYASNGSTCGRGYGSWGNSAGSNNWKFSALPFLRTWTEV